MRLLNWAKEKLKNLGERVYSRQHGEEQRFNKTAPIVQPPDRRKRSEQRKKTRWIRWYTMPTLRGCPSLSGLRLLRTMSNCTGLPLKFVRIMTPESRLEWEKEVYEQRNKRWPRHSREVAETAD